MTINAETIVRSLERVAQLTGDPYQPVYARLFLTRPEFEPLFILDRSGLVRGTMLQTSIECLIGVAQDDEVSRQRIVAARLHHNGYGVPDSQFEEMFVVMRDVFKEILADEWSDETDAEWQKLLGLIESIH